MTKQSKQSKSVLTSVLEYGKRQERGNRRNHMFSAKCKIFEQGVLRYLLDVKMFRCLVKPSTYKKSQSQTANTSIIPSQNVVVVKWGYKYKWWSPRTICSNLHQHHLRQELFTFPFTTAAVAFPISMLDHCMSNKQWVQYWDRYWYPGLSENIAC